jgi:IclR family KDG regulon transcriptional repressor
MKDERIDEIINMVGLKVYTDNTNMDVRKLKSEIETIRRNDIAFDNEEYIVGIRSAAAPIRGKKGNILAAISFAGPSARISESRMVQVAPMVKNCALEISSSFGYKIE